MMRHIRENVPFIVVFIAGAVLALRPELLDAFWIALMFGARLVFAMMFLVIQFVALFAFMGKTKTEVILPGSAKEIDLSDYWGQPKLVELMEEWVGFMQDPEQFYAMGGRLMRGMLMSGPPGTGKTYLARCLSGSADLPFLSIEGSGFRAMFIGVDIIKMMQFIGRAKRLARDYGACIAFIDEIDAVGASRGNVMDRGGGLGLIHKVMMGGGLMGGSGALTRLLYEMDGVTEPGRFTRIKQKLWPILFKKEYVDRPAHVLFIGSTNRPDILDPALTRPGRMDKKVVVDAPDRDGRREIIKGYLRLIKSRHIDLEALVSDTTNWTPAEVMTAITKDSIRFAVRAGRDHVVQEDIDNALQEAKVGMATPLGSMAEDQRYALAVHESGHAIAQHYYLPDTRIVRLTIVRHGRAYGYMMPADDVEQYIVPLERLVSMFRVSIASREAEKLVLGGSGYNSVGGDYRNAQRLADLLYRTGYFGPPVHQPDSKEITGLILGFWEEQENTVRELLEEHREELDRLVAALLERDSLRTEEVLECIASKSGP